MLKNAVTVVCTMAVCGLAHASTPVELNIDAPQSNAGLPLLSESGWPLTIRMSIALPEDAEFPGFAVQPNFPVRGDWGFIIFDDPDGCLNPPAPSWLVARSPECGFEEGDDPSTWMPPASDETYLEFWPDVDLPGVVDNAGNEDRQAALVDSASSGGPEFDSWRVATGVRSCTPDSGDSDCDQFGPYTGDEVLDGFGIGADDDIPGLVIISQFGIGQAYDEPSFDLSSPLTARNLAGLVNSVSYDLSDLNKGMGKGGGKNAAMPTEMVQIWAHVNMPTQVVRHLIQYDACVGEITYSDTSDPEVVSCAGDDLWRVDGGPIENPPTNYGRPDSASIDLLESTVFEIRAFVVAGEAPSELSDANGDGVVNSDDAAMLGYTVLSNEDHIELLQVSSLLCWGGGGNAVYFDLDGNGEVMIPIVCPGGPGDLNRPPR